VSFGGRNTVKIKRSWLIGLIIGMGILMAVYTLVRTFTPLRLGERAEKYFFDTLIFVALGVFVYNRKLAADEKKAASEKKEAEERAAAAEKEEQEETGSSEL
jgi:uncharacterized oligopeptide transporter (OPT) family protein